VDVLNTYKHIIFDIDGTLIDTEKSLLYSLQDTLKQLQSKHYELADLRFCLGIPGETALEQLGISNSFEANNIWNEHLKKYFHTIKPFPEVEELISRLKLAGYELGLITSKTRHEYAQDFIPFGLSHFFGTVICKEDSESPKPSPYPMLKYLEKTGILKHEAIYIGDTVYDMQCAKEAGVDFALAVWGNNDADHINATYFFETPGKVLETLHNHGN
jgi:HAD superfamily hydrolase (TIGR01549 family)